MENNNEKNVLLHIEDLKQYFPIKKSFGEKQRYVKANDGISIDSWSCAFTALQADSRSYYVLRKKY